MWIRFVNELCEKKTFLLLGKLKIIIMLTV